MVRLMSVAFAVGVWQLLTVADVRCWLRFDTLPTVGEISATLLNRLGTEAYWLDLAQSLVRILTGFGLAAGAAWPPEFSWVAPDWPPTCWAH